MGIAFDWLRGECMKRRLIKSAAVLLIAAFLVGCGTASIQRKSDNYIESISFDNLSSFKVSSKCVSNGKWKAFYFTA